MENSLNSSLESNTSDNPKMAVFSKPADFNQAFDVSMEESLRVSEGNKSDLVLETTSSGANKAVPFRKSRKSIQHSFNVSSVASLNYNDSEQSETFSRPQGLFAKQNKTLADFFNVSFDETNSREDTFKSMDVDETQITDKTNPFKKRNESEKEITVGMESPTQCSGEEENDDLSAAEEFQKPSSTCHDNVDGDEEADSTTFVTRANPFKVSKKPENDSLTQLRLSVTEENINYEESQNINKTASNLEINDSTELTMFASKSNVIEEKTSGNDCTLISDIERPPLLDSPAEEANPLSVWEQKLNEIVTNAEKRSQASKLKLTSDSPKKVNTLRKSKVNNENSVCPNENTEIKYKPPKLLKPASFVSKQLYAFIKKKLEPKYGIDAVIESENLVLLICDTVKKVTRRKNYQKKLIQKLKKEMAEAGLIETTMDFYEFVIKFLPYNFRVKVVPCLQPVTNMVYPPKDIANPFDKVL